MLCELMSARAVRHDVSANLGRGTRSSAKYHWAEQKDVWPARGRWKRGHLDNSIVMQTPPAYGDERMGVSHYQYFNAGCVRVCVGTRNLSHWSTTITSIM